MMNSMTSSANGQAMKAYIESVQLTLSGLTIVDYYGLPLPAPIDEKLRILINAFTALSPGQREKYMAALSPTERALFGIFGHRAATLSVRSKDREWLHLGLIGNGIGNFVIPENRDVTKSLAVFHHCARQLDLDPKTLFDDAAQFASEPMASLMRDFGARSDIALQSFGWREMRTPEGIRFKFDWQ
jgi:hypothetical protein